ncbi:brachyurin-like [Schistocerca serialis cubense]|uniref:brachyurin-like n=1 Tax=Schistocerca serialis cubense TaxID=2023355 RepID=UPI00214E9A80|nr:brachyurin-like [Schistocerca serialis cubense]
MHKATRLQVAWVAAAAPAVTELGTAPAMATRFPCALASALVVVMAGTSTQSQHAQGNPRIIEGKAAALGQFPHQALLVADDHFICGGSLITKTAVLTAGFCTVGYEKFTIRLGGIHRTKNETTSWTVVANWAVTHPDYNTETYYSHDVSVIFLPEKAPLSSFIKLVTLPSPSEVNATFVGKRALMTGWGKREGGQSYSDTLLYTEVTVIPNSVCEQDYGPGFIIESTLCAGNTNKGICSGDWGGALVQKSNDGYKQIGIASFFYDRCEVPVAAGYARVTSFLEWITRTAPPDTD